MEEKNEVKSYKKIKCFKCGNVYDDIYKRCPKCNHSNTLEILAIVGIVLVACYLIFASTYTLVKVNKLENKLNSISFASANNNYASSNETLDISQTDYYNNYLATDDNFENMINGVDTYILYFHQDGCQYCMEANAFIDRYVQLGYMNAVPVIFINPESANNVFTKYNVQDTPLAIYHNNGSDTTYKGAEEIYNLFDEIVTNNMNSAE